MKLGIKGYENSGNLRTWCPGEATMQQGPFYPEVGCLLIRNFSQFQVHFDDTRRQSDRSLDNYSENYNYRLSFYLQLFLLYLLKSF